MCFVFIWEQTATCATYSINWLVFITEMESVYSAVWTGSLNKVVCASSVKVNIATTVRSAHTVFMCFVFIWEQTATCVTYSINWLVFIIEMKSVYSAVQTGSLNQTGTVSSSKGLTNIDTDIFKDNLYNILALLIYLYRRKIWALRIKNYKTIDIKINPLNAKLNPICPLLALFGAHYILNVSS